MDCGLKREGILVIIGVIGDAHCGDLEAKLAEEVGKNIAERHGWKWAATSFMNENWSSTQEELERCEHKGIP